MTEPASRRRRSSRFHLFLFWAYTGCQLVPPLLLVLYLVGSLLLSGGRVLPNGHEIWDAVVPWPLFVVPEWLSITLSAVGLALVIPLVVTTRLPDTPQLNALFSYTTAAAVSSWFFSNSFNADGLPERHWIASVMAIICIVVILVRLATIGPFDRLRKAGLLFEFEITRRENAPARFQIDLPAAWRRVDDRGSRSAARYEPRGATSDAIPPVQISCAPLQAGRRSSFAQAAQALADASGQSAAPTGNALIRWRENSASGRSIFYAFPSAEDPRRGLVFKTSIGLASSRVTDAITDFSDSVMETFRWR